MCDNAIEKTPPASEEVTFFDTLIDGMMTSAEDVTGLLLKCVHGGEKPSGASAAASADDADHDHDHGDDHHAKAAADSFSNYFTRIFFGDAPQTGAAGATSATGGSDADEDKDEDVCTADSTFSSFGGVTIGSDMSAGVVKTEKKDNGDTVQSRLTVTAGLTYREQTRTTNPKGKLVEESDSSKAVDGSAWSTSVKYNEAGKVTERSHSFEEDDWSGFSTTVKYNADGSVSITRDVLSYHLGEYSESYSFAKKEIKDAQAQLGKDLQKHDLLTKLGNGDAAMGLLVLKDLGDGDVTKGLAVLKRFGTTNEAAVERLLTFGSGSAQEAVQRFVRVGTTIDKSITLLEKFGEGNLEKGMWRLEQLGGIKGNAGKGISVIEDLHKGYDFEAALQNLIALAKANGGSSVDDGIKFIQSLGRGNGAEGAKAARCLGDGDAKVCITHARILSGTDAREGFNILINELGKRYGVKHVADSLKRLNKDGTVAGGLDSATQYGGGICRNGVCSLNDLGVDRDGEKDLNVGIDTVFSLYPNPNPGQIVDPQAALTYARTSYGTKNDEDGHLVEDCNCVTRTLLTTTKDNKGTVSGADVKASIESLSATKDLKDGEAVLRSASDNNLISEGVEGVMSVSDDDSFLSGVNNLKSASDDGTVRNGIDQVRGFSNDGKSFKGGAANIEHVNPTGTHAANISEVKAFADPDKDGVRKFSGGSFNLRNLNLEKSITENIDEVILTGDKGPDGKQTFAGGRQNLELVNPKQTISQNIQEIVKLDDPDAEGKRDYTGGRRNLESIGPNQKTSENITEVIAMADKDATGEKTFGSGRDNIQGIYPDRPISSNIQSIIAASDVGPDGSKSFGGGRRNIERINPDAPISVNTREIGKFSDAKTEEGDFDGGIVNLQSVNPKKTIGQNIDSVKAASDRGPTGERTFVGGRSNIERVNPDAPISENIQEIIKFGNRPRKTGEADPSFDSGVRNLASVNPAKEIGSNIDTVIAFSDDVDTGHGWQHLFRGGRENLERVNYNGTIEENIQSVIAFGNKGWDGVKTFDTAIDNLHAIGPKEQLSHNIDTVIAFSDKGTSSTSTGFAALDALVGGAVIAARAVGSAQSDGRTFDGGRRNLEMVDPNGSIGENIQKVAGFSDKSNSTFADGARSLVTFSSGDVSSGIRNVLSMSDEHSFTDGTSNVRRVGDGSIEHGIENIMRLGGSMSPDPQQSAGNQAARALLDMLIPGLGSAVNAVASAQQKPTGDVAAGIAALKAAGDGSIDKGIDAVIAFGDKPGAKSFESGLTNLMALGVSEPVQIQAMAIAGSGRLADGLQRIQQYGGFEKLSRDFDGDLISGAQYLRKQHDGETTSAPMAALQPGVAQQVSLQSRTAAVASTNTANATVANANVAAPRVAREETEEERRLAYGHRPVYAPPTVTASVSSTTENANPNLINVSRVLARLSDVSQAPGFSAPVSNRGGAGVVSSAGTIAARPMPGSESPTALLRQLEASVDVSRSSYTAATPAPGARLAGAVAADAALHGNLNANPRLGAGFVGTANSLAVSNHAAMVHMVTDSRNISGAVSAYQFALNMQKSAQLVEAAVTRVNANAGIFDGKYVKGQEVATTSGAVNGGTKSLNSVIIALAINGAGGQMPGQFTDVRISRQYPVRGGIVEAGGKTQQFVFTGRLGLRPGKKLALIGPEIALAALLISAGVARVRGAEAIADHLIAADEMVLHDTDPDAQSQVRKYEPRIRPTWLVRSNEDLGVLADHLFHDARLGWLIADLNLGNASEMFDGQKRIVELRVRQKIELPVWQDIVEFHKLRVEFHASDLVTVVTETAIDQELMQLTLAPVIGIAGAPAVAPAAALAKVADAPAAALVSSAPASAKVYALPSLNAARLSESASRLAASAKTALAASRKTALLVTGKSVSYLGTKQDPTAVATVTDLVHALN